MKVIYCLECEDIIKLDGIKQYCFCGNSHGYYLPGDNLNAKYGGSAVPLCIDNDSFDKAVNGQLKRTSVVFTAFVIPEECETFKKE